MLRPGTYILQDRKNISDSSISTGNRSVSAGIENSEITTLITARTGTVFGAEFAAVGAPQGARVPVKIVWRYPQPGLKNPNGAAARLVDEYMGVLEIGRTSHFYWEIAQAWQIVPGVWTIEIWYADRKLASQNFTVVKG